MFLSAGETKKEVKEEVSKMTDELSSKMESAKLEDKVRTNKDLVAIEAFIFGNITPLFKRKFSYRMGPISSIPVTRSLGTQDSTRHQMKDGYYLSTLFFCGSSGLDITASKSQAFSQKLFDKKLRMLKMLGLLKQLPFIDLLES